MRAGSKVRLGNHAYHEGDGSERIAAVASQEGKEAAKKGRRFYHRLALAAAIVLTLFTVFQIPQVATYAETIVKTFTDVFLMCRVR